MQLACVQSHHGLRGCSIVVHEGMYIDPSFALGYYGMMSASFAKGFSLEIVGVEKVRILNTAHVHSVFSPQFIELTLRNLTIYGRGELTGSTIFAFGATLTLVDVRTHGSRACVVELEHGTNFDAVNCAFSECMTPFYVKESKATFKDCVWRYRETSGGSLAYTIKDSDDCSVRFGQIINGTASFHQCQFLSGTGEPDKSRKSGKSGKSFTDSKIKCTAITMTTRGKLFMTECCISGFHNAIETKDSFTKAVVKRSKILDCGLAVEAKMNSEVTVSDCELAVKHVVMLSMNIEGKVRFKRNSVRQTTRRFPYLPPAPGGNTVIIWTDREPKVLKHDFAKTCIKYLELVDSYLPGEMYGSTRASRKGHARWNAETKSDGLDVFGEDFPDAPDSELRECLHCLIAPLEKPEAKFQYCSRCRKVSYCSKECQVANWRDHKYRCKKD